MNREHYPFPPSFEQRMRQTLQEGWTAFEQAHHQPAPVSVRTNPKKHTTAIQGNRIPWTSHGYYLQERPVFTLDPTFHAGAYYVQEASSMFLEQVFRQVIDLNSSLHVLDLCAAPGGKSTHISSLLNDQSLLVSNEVIRSRAGILAENLQKWGNGSVVVTNNDPEDFQRISGFFDVIVVDAPCSGEGLFRKDADAMREWSEENVQLCSKRQRRILSDVWSSLKENGMLVYSTCTYNGLENEENLRWLKDEHAVEFLPLQLDPSWNVETIQEGDLTGYRFYPHRVKGEGFFISVIRKKEPQAEPKIKGQKDLFAPPSKKIMEQITSWVAYPEEKAFILRDDQLQFFPANQKHSIEWLAKNLRLVSAGTFLATVKHDKLVPEHALALSNEINKENFFTLEVTHEEALQYLRKETLNTTAPHKGFALITYEHLPLGWVNVLPNRLNNLYPQEWRIRMK